MIRVRLKKLRKELRGKKELNKKERRFDRRSSAHIIRSIRSVNDIKDID